MKNLRDRVLKRLLGAVRRKQLMRLAKPLPQASFAGTLFLFADMAYNDSTAFDPMALALAALATLVMHVLLYDEE